MQEIEKPSRVVVLYESPKALRAVYPVFRQQSNFHIIASAIRESTTLEWVIELCPDLVLVELEALTIKSHQIISQLTTRFPALPVILFTRHDTAGQDRVPLNCGAYVVPVRRIGQKLPQLLKKALPPGIPAPKRSPMAMAQCATG